MNLGWFLMVNQAIYRLELTRIWRHKCRRNSRMCSALNWGPTLSPWSKMSRWSLNRISLNWWTIAKIFRSKWTSKAWIKAYKKCILLVSRKSKCKASKYLSYKPLENFKTRLKTKPKWMHLKNKKPSLIILTECKLLAKMIKSPHLPSQIPRQRI